MRIFAQDARIRNVSGDTHLVAEFPPMDTKQIHDALAKLFLDAGERIVFWHDPAHEFIDFMNRLPFLTFEHTMVQIIRLDEVGGLETKLRLERDDPEGQFLLYSPTEEPEYDADWLLDIRLYSRSFRADRASIILEELGLESHHLREHLAARRTFFDNKERLQKFKVLVDANDTADDLDRKMLAVVVKAEQPEPFTIIRTLFHAFTEVEHEDEIDLGNSPPCWDQIEKYDLAEPFWQFIKHTFGYSEDSPSLRNLLVRLLVTDYAHHLQGEVPSSLEHLILPKSGQSNAVVCLAQWRDSSSKGSSYDLLSAEVACIVKIAEYVHPLDIEALIDVMTFREVEEAMMRGLRDRVLATADTITVEEIRAIATRRQDGHWASLNVSASPTVPRRALHAVYDALVAAADFFDLRNRHRNGFDFDTATAMYRAYETELFEFDQLYRRFCEAADVAEAQNWDVLKKLREQVEAVYVNWYITTQALAWGKFIAPAGDRGLLKRWHIDQVPNQHEFYQQHIQRRLSAAENRKAFVIISDAFRYEAAHELTQELNGKYRFEAELSSQLGVLPSYTALGMAALLPHTSLTYKPNADVLVDDRPTASLEQRHDILAGVGGLVCKADELLAMKKEAGRKLVSGKKVVYIYHNTVDVVGESSNEAHTFEAVRSAINQLAALVSYIINTLNGNYVVITADHGFLFTETAPDETAKSALAEKPQGTVTAKRRYVLGHHLPDSDSAWHGTTAVTAGAQGDMEFWIPRAANRFHFMGSQRFVHGGAMLQEIVVPVVTVWHKKDKAARLVTRTKPVTVHVLGTSHKITAPRHRFELLQMEPVSERIKPLTLKAAVYEGDEPVTNIETVTFDSVSGNLDERKKWLPLVLRDRPYDKHTPYHLILREAETGIEQSRVDVVIDRVFADDF
jgi:uncharacterized protein (TIGR02687 family)